MVLICFYFEFLSFFFWKVVGLFTATQAWYPGSDHYWPLNEIRYNQVYDHRYFNGWWNGYIRGNEQLITASLNLWYFFQSKRKWASLEICQQMSEESIQFQKYCSDTTVMISMKILFTKSVKFWSLHCFLITTGNAEITWSSPQIGLDLYGPDTWIDFGVRYNSCYVDVKYCNQTGFSVAFWVAFQESSTSHGLIEFGSGDCGLSLARTPENEINATIKSMELNITWSFQSVNASVRHGMWHHLALTWNASGEAHLFINGTRYASLIAFGLKVFVCHLSWSSSNQECIRPRGLT